MEQENQVKEKEKAIISSVESKKLPQKVDSPFVKYQKLVQMISSPNIKQKNMVNQTLFNNPSFPAQISHLSGIPQVGIFSS